MLTPQKSAWDIVCGIVWSTTCDLIANSVLYAKNGISWVGIGQPLSPIPKTCVKAVHILLQGFYLESGQLGPGQGFLAKQYKSRPLGPDFAGTPDYMCSVGEVKQIGVAYRYKKSDVSPERACSMCVCTQAVGPGFADLCQVWLSRLVLSMDATGGCPRPHCCRG